MQSSKLPWCAVRSWLTARSTRAADARCLQTVERFDATAERWEPAPPMLEARCALGVALSHATQQLFAAGGYNGGDEPGGYLAPAEYLELSAGSRGSWRALPPMSCERAGANAAVGPDGRIYVVGGGPDGRREWATMEALDLRTGEWDSSLAPLHVGRHYNAAAFGPDGRLYCSGAFRHDGQLDVVERYDPRANRWEELPPIGQVVTFSAGAFVWG